MVLIVNPYQELLIGVIIFAVIVLIIILKKFGYLVAFKESDTYKEYVVPVEKPIDVGMLKNRSCFIRILSTDLDKDIEHQYKEVLDTSGVWNSFWRKLFTEEEAVINKFLKDHPDFEKSQAVRD